MEYVGLKKIRSRNTTKQNFKDAIFGFGNVFELLVILFVWYLILSSSGFGGGLSQKTILTYLITGNFISIITGSLLQYIVVNNTSFDKKENLISTPFKYLRNVSKKAVASIFLPFMLAISIQAVLLYFLLGSIPVNLSLAYLLVISVLVFLSFIFELMLVYLLSMFVFWEIESKNFFTFILRVKKILAGAYFPLSILSSKFLSISLAMPFAYSFFVPTELYLKNIDISIGIRGVAILIFWVILLYIVIQKSWEIKVKNISQIEENE